MLQSNERALEIINMSRLMDTAFKAFSKRQNAGGGCKTQRLGGHCITSSTKGPSKKCKVPLDKDQRAYRKKDGSNLKKMQVEEKRKRKTWKNWECSSLAECLPRMWRPLVQYLLLTKKYTRGSQMAERQKDSDRE
jgi:hypothetical protein